MVRIGPTCAAHSTPSPGQVSAISGIDSILLLQACRLKACWGVVTVAAPLSSRTTVQGSSRAWAPGSGVLLARRGTLPTRRSEQRRVGKEGVGTVRIGG